MRNIKEYLFYDVFKSFKDNPKQLLYMLLFDALFVMIVVSTNLSLRLIKPANVYIGVFVQLVHLLLFVFVYSFFKYCILNIIASIANEKKFSFDRLFKFFHLNLSILIIIIIIFYVLGFIYSSVIKPDSGRVIAFSLFSVYLLVCYVLINISHSFFALGCNLRNTFRKTMAMLKKIKDYGKILLFSALVILIYFILCNLIIYMLNIGYSDVSAIFLSPLQMNIFSVITIIILYLTTVFNRLYFYLVIKKQVN